MDVKAKSVTVVGLGISGKAMARWLHGRGAKVAVSERGLEREHADWLRENRRILDRMEFGGHTKKFLLASDLIVLSPGVPPDLPPLKASAEAGIPMTGELELVLEDCPARIFAITGTNGKTTTSSLLGHLLRVGGVRASLAGNIGVPVSDAMSRAAAGHTLVLEISSFQLETARSFHPRVAVLLNVTPDHMDRYKSLEEYARTKERIFANQAGDDLAILNRCDPGASAMSARIKSRVRWFNSKGPESAGTGVSEGWIVRQDGEMREKIMPAAQLPLRGPHNLENALAACEAAREAGVDAASLADGLKSFAGVEHRLEPAGSIGQVVFINDSKATNVEAMEKALQSFPERVVLIAGGRDKNLDFRSARELAAERVKQAILIGEAAEKIAASWQGAVPLSKAETLEEAVGRAYEVTRPRGTVLLSPGCASFDMFLNFEDRGRKFRTAVSKLAASVTHGERVAQ